MENNVPNNSQNGNWLDRARQWPQKKKLNFIFTFTGIVILVLIIIWLIIGGYTSSDGSSARSTINSIINGIKNH